MANIHNGPSAADELLTPKQAAEYLKCSVCWLAQLRMMARGPAFTRHGRWLRYRRADLEKWIERGRVPAGAEQTASSPLAAA
jgi:hypothetical protein